MAQLSDDFSGVAINTNKWRVVLPFKNKFITDWNGYDVYNVTSTASQSGGKLLLRNGGFVTSRQSFSAPYIYSGTFNQSSGRTMISLRGDGASFEPSYGGPSGSIMLFLFGDPNNTPNWKVEILQSTQANPYWFRPVSETFRNNNFPLTEDGPNTFSISDNGTSLEVKINDVLISRSTVSTVGFGGHVSIASQWLGAVDVDLLNVGSHQSSPVDTDNDGVNDYREGKDGTDPNSASSFNPLSKGLVAYYPFDGNAKDESGHGAHATPTKVTFAQGANGIPDGAASFDGSSSYLTAPHSPPTNNAFTWSVWVKPNALGGMALIQSADVGVNGVSPLLELRPGGKVRFYSYDTKVSGEANLANWFDSPSVVTASKWHLVTATSDVQNRRKLYIDGVLQGAGLSSGYGEAFSNLIFGADRWLQESWLYGALDDLRIYNRALSATEVGQLYQTEAGNLDSDNDGLADAWERGYGRYQVVLGNFTWSQAKADAELKGGYITTITSEDEKSAMLAVLGQHFLENGSYHLGATDEQSEGRWTWVTGEKWGFTDWAPLPSAPLREPNGGTGENYLEIFAAVNPPWDPQGAATKFRWNDASASHLGPYILEFGYPTDPLKADTDGDGFNDKVESDAGSDPNDPSARPLPRDSDNDGVNDYREGKDGTDPNNVGLFNPLSKGLVAYYPFDGNAKDESGNGRDATVSGGAVLSSDRWGAPSAAFSFDGIDDVIQRDGALVDCSTATGITFSGWVYYASAPAGAPFVSSQNVASFSGWGIWNYQGRISGLSGRRYVAPLMQIDANKIASSGQWYHVVLSSEFGNSTSRLYVDGALQKESRQPVVNDVLLDRLAIGKWLGTETHLKGKCDAVRVYDRALSATEVAQLYKAESQNPNMIAVKGGTLPPSSEWLAGQKVEDFEIGKYEVTWGEWKVVRSWAVTNGYTDLANVGAGSGDDHPVRNVNWYDVVKWCNAKSQMEGLVPVYEVNGSVYKTGQAAPTAKSSATGYRLPTEAEWEWAARGGISTKGYTYSGANEVNSVAWYSANSGGGTKAVGTKGRNELGAYDMSGNVSEWCETAITDSPAYYFDRFIRGGSWDLGANRSVVSLRDTHPPSGREQNLGFRLARKADAPADTTPPAVKITSIAANARLTSATATFAGTVTEPGSKPTLQYRLGTNGVWSNSVVGGTASPYSFSQSITLKPGPNAVQFQAQDGAGNKSAIAAVNVSYVVPATLNVAVPNAADGSISSGFGGNTAREVGVTYTITATPASGMVFKEWLKNGTSFSTNAALTFKMEAGLKLTPVFVPDFAKLGGVYNGLIGTGEIGTGSAADRQAFVANNGFIQINTAANGALSGVLRIQGGNHPFTGTMGANKKAMLTITRPGKAAATAVLNLITALPGEISGTVTAGGAAIPFRALRGGHTASTGTHALGGRRYGIVLPPPAGIALGYGYGTLTVDNDGSAVLAAHLATGQAINAGARIVDDGKGNWVLPVYAGASGIFTGEIVIPKTAPSAGSELGGSLEWLKTPGSSGPAKDGFLKALQPLGARHNVATAGLGGAAFTLNIDPARRILSAPLLQAGQWGNGAAPGLTAPVRSALNVGFNPLSGEFRGSFTRSKNGVPVITPFQGGLFSRPLTIPGGTALRGAGFFNDGNSSAAVEVRSP